jgi:protease II
VFFRDRILSITDHNSPNLRVIELRFHPGTEPEWKDVIPVSDSRILQWVLAGERIVILYGKNMDRQIRVFELSEGKEGRGGAGAGLSARQTDEVAINPDETFRISSAGPASDEVILERESFTEPVRIVRCSPANKECSLWAEKTIPACASDIVQTQIPIHRKTGPGFRCTSWAARKSLRGAAIPPS